MKDKDEYITCAEALIKMLSDEDVALDEDPVQLERSV
jgi:hypothetical protein